MPSTKTWGSNSKPPIQTTNYELPECSVQYMNALLLARLPRVSKWGEGTCGTPLKLWCSLPELVDFKLFGKTNLVVNKKFKLFLASQLVK